MAASMLVQHHAGTQQNFSTSFSATYNLQIGEAHPVVTHIKADAVAAIELCCDQGEDVTCKIHPCDGIVSYLMGPQWLEWEGMEDELTRSSDKSGAPTKYTKVCAMGDGFDVRVIQS